ncbi:hypothetical protein [Ruminobacter sp.]|uniref:hypothetical protein n=1 Tax=Ruminobacter sp. TaxID=2774296 RepID=UPI00386CA0D4
MRLVDIEPIVELVKGEHEKVQTRFNEANVFKEPNEVALWGAVLQEVGAFIGLMINAPSVDAVPVIRCEDCKHQSTFIDGQKVCMLPNGYTPLGYDEGYCSMAERKEECD